MAGRGPAIHVFLVCVGQKTWVAGPSPAMTVGATHGSSSMSFGITRRYGLHRLVWFEQHDDIRVAVQRETNMKRWPRAWKVRLLAHENPDWEDLYPTLLG
jgi:putative endonuclease